MHDFSVDWGQNHVGVALWNGLGAFPTVKPTRRRLGDECGTLPPSPFRASFRQVGVFPSGWGFLVWTQL